MDLLRRKSTLRRFRPGQLRMPGIAVNIDPFVEDLLADFRLAAGSRKRTPPFFSTARVEGKREWAHEIGDRLRFENRRIHTGFEHAWIARVERFANSLIRNTRSVEFRHVEMV